MNRLTQVSYTDPKNPTQPRVTRYVFGSTGNRTSKTETQGLAKAVTDYVYDTDDRLSSETKTQGVISATTAYSWDNNGNLIQKTTPTETTLYAWDSNNRLVEVKRGGIAANATTVASYQYDANGNRIGKTTADGKTVTYLIDSNLPFAQVAEEKSTLGNVSDTTTYLYGIERIQMIRAGQGTYYHDDGLGSTRALTDQTGNLTDSYDYDDYGALQSQTGTTKNDFLFTGEQFDVEAGLYYNRARHLDTGTGRFTGLDPFAGNPRQPITLNKYAYAGGDPVNATDPSGLMGLQDQGAAASVEGTLNGITIPNVGVQVNYAAGKAFEKVVLAELDKFTAQYGGKVFTQVLVKDPGGRRFVDFVYKMGDKLILIEAKTKVPYGGGALVRLAGQLKTYLNPGAIGSSANPVTGEIVQVIVVTEEGIAASEVAFARIAAKLESGSMGPVLSGSIDLIGLLRPMLIGF